MCANSSTRDKLKRYVYKDLLIIFELSQTANVLSTLKKQKEYNVLRKECFGKNIG